MSRFIPAMPVLSAWRCRPPGETLPFPLGRDDASLWHCARTAIWQGARALGLREGDRVLVPAYACGSELDALLGAGLTLVYYRIRPDLAADLDHIHELCRTPARAIYITHYFGFPQPMPEILAFVREHGLLLMEDNAHGLYSADTDGKPLGSFGDMAVFSFPKTLPVPDGGALVLNGVHRDAARRLEAESPRLRPVVGRLKFLAGESLSARFPRGKRSGRDPDDASREPSPAETDRLMRRIRFDAARARWTMFTPTRLLVRSAAHARIRDRRRRNWLRLAEAVGNEEAARPLLSRLPEGCCPLFFPVRTADSHRLQAFLLERGIESKRIWSFPHPALPGDEFPFERMLRQSVVALPVHQDLDERDMERMSATLNAWVRLPR